MTPVQRFVQDRDAILQRQTDALAASFRLAARIIPLYLFVGLLLLITWHHTALLWLTVAFMVQNVCQWLKLRSIG